MRIVTEQPYVDHVPTAELGRLAAALHVVEEHAELNHRYNKLISESQRQLAGQRVRLTQARGIAKKLMVLVRAGGDELRGKLSTTEGETLDAGMAEANELVYDT